MLPAIMLGTNISRLFNTTRYFSLLITTIVLRSSLERITLMIAALSFYALNRKDQKLTIKIDMKKGYK